MKVIVYLSALLTVIGGLNCGVTGFFGFNAIETFLCCPAFIQIAYCLIGLGAIIFTLAFIGCFSGVCMCKCGGACTCGSKCSCNDKKDDDKKD